MFNSTFRSPRQALLVVAASVACALATTGCSGGEGTVARPTPQGTIEFNQCKVGMPETTFKDAIMTFVPDPGGSFGAKKQYLSRGSNADGGQYMAQCTGDRCYELQIVYKNGPVSKDVAMKAVHELIPETAPPQSKDDDSQLKKAATPVETIWFGNDYRSEIAYADKAGTQVVAVNAWYAPKQEASSTPAAPSGN